MLNTVGTVWYGKGFVMFVMLTGLDGKLMCINVDKIRYFDEGFALGKVTTTVHMDSYRYDVLEPLDEVARRIATVQAGGCVCDGAVSGKDSGESFLKADDALNDCYPCVRGFELIKGKEGVRLPERATEFSAGYDFFACEDVEILPHTTRTVWTGVKAFMPPDEVLKVYNRSSNARKKGLFLSNGVGVVDSDYYNNPSNEGDIGFDFYNISDEIVTIRKGEKLGQAIFEKYSLADNDIHGGKRTGGFGSTGK